MSRILIIDDNKSDQLLAQQVCQSLGYTTVCVSEGFEALEQLDAEPFSLIVTDLLMPHISGIDLVKRIKSQQKTREIKTIVMSSRNQELYVKKALQAGAIDYLVKPIDPLILKEKITRHMINEIPWKEYEVSPEGPFSNCSLAFTYTLLSISEIGATIRTPWQIPIDSYFRFHVEENETRQRFVEEILAIVQSHSQDGTNFISKIRFVGQTESQRKQLRILCRKIWMEDKEEL
ncbi:MAG: response regulator [Bdellovibrionales bacterium]|nr:response regulator [Bdellovibrionales bacterium]